MDPIGAQKSGFAAREEDENWCYRVSAFDPPRRMRLFLMKLSPKISKKQILLDFWRRQNLSQFGLGELHAARNELRRQLGPGDRTSLGYVASIAREAGYQVQYEDPYSDPVMPEPYATQSKGVLAFHDLRSAEQSLLRFDELYREYSSAGDQLGVKFVRALVKKGQLRAQRLAANARVRASKRQEKLEIARWFQVWLETPDLFFNWLELRKSSEEFCNLFGSGNLPG
jgi:hypothetical protein